MITEKLLKYFYWGLTIVGVVVLSVSATDLYKEVTLTETGNKDFSEKLSYVFTNETERAMNSFEYIGNTILANMSAEDKWTPAEETFSGSLDVSVNNYLYLNSPEGYSELTIKYGLSTNSHEILDVMEGTKEIWRLELNTEKNQLDLVMGKRMMNLPEMPIVEIKFDLSKYPPIIPYQLNSTLVYVDNAERTYLRSPTAFEPVAFQFDTTPSTGELSEPESEKLVMTAKSFLGYNYYENLNNSTKQYQMTEVYLPDFRSTVLIFMDSRDQLEKIHEDVAELLLSIAGILFSFVFVKYSIRFFNHTRKLMYCDALTGLKNRYHLESYESRFEQKIQQDGMLCGVLALDIDFFKKVNDQYGHGVGDKVLVRIANILKSNVRKDDECYRLGGEEFAVLTCMYSKEQIVLLAERIRKAIEQDAVLNKLVVGGVTSSIGVSAISEYEESKIAFKEADEQLYMAKRNGRNQVQHNLGEFA